MVLPVHFLAFPNFSLSFPDGRPFGHAPKKPLIGWAALAGWRGARVSQDLRRG